MKRIVLAPEVIIIRNVEDRELSIEVLKESYRNNVFN